ncbi:MAG: RNA methyltransferase [Pseudomonadota bacterium]
MTKQRVSRKNARDGVSPAPIFVLVEPQMGENIGAAARAMLNFGVSGLRLVNPRDGWPNAKAGAMAAGAAIVIDHTEVFETLEDAIADCQYVIATTARMRELALPVLPPVEAAANLETRISAGQRCAVVFGGERSGLSSDDVARTDAILSVPVNPAFASLNLSQAVLLIAYEWSRASGVAAIENPMADEAPAKREDLSRFLDRFEASLDAAGYFFPPEKRSGMVRNLRAAFTRAGFTELELSALHGAIKALSRKAEDQAD